MKRRSAVALATACAWLAGMTATQAADTWSIPGFPLGTDIQSTMNTNEQMPTELVIQLGTMNDELVLMPQTLRFEKGKLYRLVIRNPSDTAHYFWAPSFGGNAVETRLIDVGTGNAKMRLSGHPADQHKAPEFEVQPGGTAAWEFVPLLAGRYGMGCALRDHAKAGMNGEFVVG